MATLEELLGEGVVVRSDDVDGNEVRGTVVRDGDERSYVAVFTDDGAVVSCVLGT